MIETKKSKALNVSLWVAQSLLAAMFLIAGITKFTTSIEDQRKMEWAKHVSTGLIYFVGMVEVLGAIGLLLPAILKIKPWLTSWAATGVVLVMVLAAALNLSVGDTKPIVPILIIAAVGIFIAWGRFKKVPIKPRD